MPNGMDIEAHSVTTKRFFPLGEFEVEGLSGRGAHLQYFAPDNRLRVDSSSVSLAALVERLGSVFPNTFWPHTGLARSCGRRFINELPSESGRAFYAMETNNRVTRTTARVATHIKRRRRRATEALAPAASSQKRCSEVSRITPCASRERKTKESPSLADSSDVALAGEKAPASRNREMARFCFATIRFPPIMESTSAGNRQFDNFGFW